MRFTVSVNMHEFFLYLVVTTKYGDVILFGLTILRYVLENPRENNSTDFGIRLHSSNQEKSSMKQSDME